MKILLISKSRFVLWLNKGIAAAFYPEATIYTARTLPEGMRIFAEHRIDAVVNGNTYSSVRTGQSLMAVIKESQRDHDDSLPLSPLPSQH